MEVRKYLVGIAAGLVIGGGAGTALLANAADPTPNPAPAASAGATAGGTPTPRRAPVQDGERGHRGGPRGGMGLAPFVHGEMASQVASALGVDEGKLTEAAKTVAQETKDKYRSQGSTRPDREALKDEAMTSLASKLGVDKAALTKAIDDAMAKEQAADRAEHRDGLKSRLDKAVTDGKITQADADSVLKAYDAGVLGGGRR